MKAVSDAERIRQKVLSGGLDCLERSLANKAFAAGAAPDEPMEKRREPRFPVVRDITVRAWTPPTFEIVPGQVRDISRSGVGMVIDAAIPAGCEIEFRVGEFQVFAEVRHCRARHEGGFLMGAKIHDVVLPDGQHADHLGE
ncbi:MAG: PilZ domain-containing protein [Bryobacteraceae bacterium]